MYKAVPHQRKFLAVVDMDRFTNGAPVIKIEEAYTTPEGAVPQTRVRYTNVDTCNVTFLYPMKGAGSDDGRDTYSIAIHPVVFLGNPRTIRSSDEERS